MQSHTLKFSMGSLGCTNSPALSLRGMSTGLKNPDADPHLVMGSEGAAGFFAQLILKLQGNPARKQVPKPGQCMSMMKYNY